LAGANQKVAVLTLLRREQRWPGPPPERFRLVPNKPALQFKDQPTWAEFVLLRLLEGDGWNGAWVKAVHFGETWKKSPFCQRPRTLGFNKSRC
jgi:hypothetical protein